MYARYLYDYEFKVQRLSAKLYDINLLLNVFAQHEQPIQVVWLQETWLEIHDYNLVTQNRYDCAHGGLAFCIHRNWSYILKPCDNKSPYWEEMFVTVANPIET